MKTWEMIKELTENPNKEFISKEVGIFAEQKAYGIIDEYGEPTIKIVNMETGNPIGSHHINRKWEEVKKPVTWEVAFKAGLEEKRIKPEGQHLTFPDYKNLNYVMLYLSERPGYYKKIMLGNWYIED